MRVMEKLVVIGGGGHAKVLISVLKKLPWNVVGYTDVEDRGAILGVPCVGDDAMLPDILSTHWRCAALVGVGKVDASLLRMHLQERAESLGFTTPVIVSPDAIVNDEVVLGAGTAILDAAIVNSGTATGRGCIVNTNSTVEHDCHLGDNVHVASGATVCGGVTIGHNCLIGAGAIVVQGARICDGCLVGAGAVVTRDLLVPGTYVGLPAEHAR
jgi:sugar O-acyltransferase (sialic acid O-acetyltransferase NeuD family)